MKIDQNAITRVIAGIIGVTTAMFGVQLGQSRKAQPGDGEPCHELEQHYPEDVVKVLRANAASFRSPNH